MTYRNPKLLALAKEAPHCMYCGMDNYGQVVAAHSNSLMHNKGTGTKADDIVSYLCDSCHSVLDGRMNPGLIEMTRKDRQLMFYDSMFKTFRWLLESGHLEVK